MRAESADIPGHSFHVECRDLSIIYYPSENRNEAGSFYLRDLTGDAFEEHAPGLMVTADLLLTRPSDSRIDRSGEPVPSLESLPP
jgi:hypothetical protein